MLTAVCLAGWAVPGAAHLWLGRRQKGAVFLVFLSTMFVVGLLLHGRILPFQTTEILAGLAAVAQMGLGVPWLLSRLTAAGAGTVTAATHEYGNAFLVVAGLLNFLVIIDAYDIALGRK